MYPSKYLKINEKLCKKNDSHLSIIIQGQLRLVFEKNSESKIGLHIENNNEYAKFESDI